MFGEKITKQIACVQGCGTVVTLVMDADDYVAWRSGTKLIQNAFPYLKPADREMLKTGICGACWDKMFGPER